MFRLMVLDNRGGIRALVDLCRGHQFRGAFRSRWRGLNDRFFLVSRERFAGKNYGDMPFGQILLRGRLIRAMRSVLRRRQLAAEAAIASTAAASSSSEAPATATATATASATAEIATAATTIVKAPAIAVRRGRAGRWSGDRISGFDGGGLSRRGRGDRVRAGQTLARHRFEACGAGRGRRTRLDG